MDGYLVSASSSTSSSSTSTPTTSRRLGAAVNCRESEKSQEKKGTVHLGGMMENREVRPLFILIEIMTKRGKWPVRSVCFRQWQLAARVDFTGHFVVILRLVTTFTPSERKPDE